MAKIKGTKFAELLTGTAKADQIFGLAGNDTLIGLAGNDTLDGGKGKDKLDGGLGNDTLDGGKGKDKMSGGKGDDTYIVDNIGDKVIEKAGQGTDSVKTTLNAYTLGNNVEKLAFSSKGDFTGTGNALDNDIVGGTGTNTLYGGAGNDVLNAGFGVNHLSGGDGIDTVSYANAGPFTLTSAFNYAFAHFVAGAQVGVNFNIKAADSGTLWAADGDTFGSIENGVGSQYADVIDMYTTGTVDGGAGNDSLQLFSGGTVYGGTGDDGIGITPFINGAVPGAAYGGDGNDHIDISVIGSTADGGAGDDTIQLFASDNTANGGAGNDTLNAGRGNHKLDGGAGNDNFYFYKGASASVDGTVDVYNFDHVAGAGGDVLHLQDAGQIPLMWSGFESNGDTVFRIEVFGTVFAQITIHGVTGLVAGDDYVIF
jgi:Ca2+-binding RTX toxin-like protein